MNNEIKKVVIVGGGSAGWITAAYLNGALNQRGADPQIDVTLVESPDVPRISVGEATVPSISHTLEVVGADETEFMKATDATFKQSIKYVNWLEKDGTGYHHPFSRATPGPIDFTGRRWMESQRDIPYMETVSAQAVISEIDRAPKMLQGQRFERNLKYAYHFDAQLFADYLRDLAVDGGVEHILANVTKVNQSEAGYIQSVSQDRGDDIEGDLFIDCTGFKSILMEKAMDVPFDDFSQWLFCDQAIVANFPYEDFFPGTVRPYTTCTAQSAGWIWDTPTMTRRAIGYVHSSKYVDPDEARNELLAYQGGISEDYETRLIRFKVGQRQKAWTKNCLAVGLSGGFIEPLESTGIYLCELAAVTLAELFPKTTDQLQTMAFRFNRIISNRYYEILDFINMHYCLSRRTDSEFWRDVQKDEHITDRLQAKLAFWREKAPTRADFEDQAFMGFEFHFDRSGDPEIDPRPPTDSAGLWDHQSYEAILWGMDFRGPEFATKPGDARQKARALPFVLKTIQSASQQLPPHHIWLHKELGMKPWETGPRPAGWIKPPYL